MKVKINSEFNAQVIIDLESKDELVFLKELLGNLSKSESERIAGIKMPQGDLIQVLYATLEGEMKDGQYQ